MPDVIVAEQAVEVVGAVLESLDVVVEGTDDGIEVVSGSATPIEVVSDEGVAIEVVGGVSFIEITTVESPVEVLVEGATGPIEAVSGDGTPIEVLGIGGADGADGAQGPQGEQGVPGQSSNTGGSWHHSQALASDHWHIVHGLNFTPNWSVVDSGGSRAFGEEVNTPGVTDIYFSASFGGDAYGS